MADPRGFPQGGQQGQYGMNPVHSNFTPMQQQQYVMMQQQQAMMMQQRAAFVQQQQQQQAGMFQRQTPPPQGSYVHSSAQIMPPYPGQSFRPPAYTPQMAQEFKAKQERVAAQQAKLMEEQRKRMEQAMKEQKFKEQQQKLKEFKAIGVRKIDPDSLINSILGTPNVRPAAPNIIAGAGGTMPRPQGPPPPVQASENIEDDSFGEFMTGPSNATSDQPMPTPAQTNEGGQNNVSEPDQSQATTDVSSQAPPAHAAQEKKDLMSMMMECSDLTAPKEAKSFVKKTAVKDAPKNIRKAVYQASQKSRRWDGETENLSELFTVEQPKVLQQPLTGTDAPPVPEESGSSAQTSQPGPPKTLPKWCLGEAHVPELYCQVLEASLKEYKIDTSLLYPILLRSGLPREILGHIWALANRKEPGQLQTEELWIVLALIACAQNNVNIMTLDVLYELPQPPVPFLGHNQPAGHAPASAAPAATPVSGAVVTESSAPPVMTPGSTVAQVQSPNEDDFDDFQEAPPMSTSASFGSFTAASPPSVVSPESGPKKAGTADLMGPEDKYSELRIAGEQRKESSQGLSDFMSSTRDSSFSFGNVSAALPNPSAMSKTHSEPTFGNVASSKTVSSCSDIANLEVDDFDDFKSGNDDFADFQSAGSSLSGSANHNKLATLKALVQSTELYKPRQKEDNGCKEKKEDIKLSNDSDTWADFKEAEAPAAKDKYSAFKQALASVCPEQPDLFDVKTPPDDEGETWAEFATAEPKSHIPSDDDWFAQSKERKHDRETDSGSQSFKKSDSETSFTGFESAEIPAPGESSKVKVINMSSSKVQPSVGKGINYFARNLDVSGISAGTGMSPLDITPPELPDIRDEEDEDGSGFDKFGTFQSHTDVASRPGLSSLVTPYGGFDDIGEPAPRFAGSNTSDMFSFNSQPRQKAADKDNVDSISNSSSEFTGWKNQSKSMREDTQSVSSLDLNTVRPQRGSKDGSPAGPDSQSVSSLEFGTVDMGRKSGSPQDEQSIASLELKMASPEGLEGTAEELGQETANDNTFGEFSSAIEHIPVCSQDLENGASDIFPPKPRDASELLQTGNPPSFGDRYSGLIQQPQDNDRHRYDWQRCLEKCCEIIQDGNNTFNSVSSPSVCEEVIGSERGSEYLQGIVEIFRVVCRLRISMKAVSVSSTRLSDLLRDIELAWTNLSCFLGSSSILPRKEACDFSPGILKVEDDNAQQRACGLCLLDVNSRSKSPEADKDTHKLTYGGRSYHSTCANFWINCVDSTLPTLTIPELL